MGLQTRHKLDGTPYKVWKPERMPRLPDNHLGSVFYVYPSPASAAAGEALGGCGFFVSIPFSTLRNAHHIYAVSNRHVIDHRDPQDGDAPTIRVNRKDGSAPGSIVTEFDEWTGPHGSDFCVRYMTELDGSLAWRHEGLDRFADASVVVDYGLGIGDDVFSIGRFIDRDGRKVLNTPIARFGNVALMPEVEVPTDGGGYEKVYLVEMRSRGGFSGSPVFVYVPPLAADFQEKPRLRTSEQFGPWILGIHSLQLPARGPEAIVMDSDGAARTSFATAITGVVPAYKIKDYILNTPELIEQRAAHEQWLEHEAKAEYE